MASARPARRVEFTVLGGCSLALATIGGSSTSWVSVPRASPHGVEVAEASQGFARPQLLSALTAGVGSLAVLAQRRSARRELSSFPLRAKNGAHKLNSLEDENWSWDDDLEAAALVKKAKADARKKYREEKSARMEKAAERKKKQKVQVQNGGEQRPSRDEQEVEAWETWEPGQEDWQAWVEKPTTEEIVQVLVLAQQGEAKPADLEKVLSSLRRGDVLQSEDEYKTALSLMCTPGKIRQLLPEAVKILACMWFNNIKPTGKHYGPIINACLSTGRFNKGKQLFEEMVEYSIPRTELCYNAAIYCYARTNEDEAAVQLLEDMVRQGLAPSSATYEAVFAALSTEGHWLKAVNVFDLLLEKGIAPTTQIFNSIIAAHGNGGNLDGALQFMKMMTKMEVEMTPDTYYYILKACESNSAGEKAFKIFNSMSKSWKLLPKIQEALMCICIQDGNPDRAIFIHDETVARRKESKSGDSWQRKGKPYVQSERILAMKCLEAIEQASRTSDSPDEGRSTYKERACRILQDMETSEMLLETESWVMVLGTCENQVDWKLASQLILEMDEKGIQVSEDRRKTVFRQAISYAGKAQALEEVWKLFSHLDDRKDVVLEADIYDLVVDILKDTNQVARAEQVATAKESRYTKQFCRKIIGLRNKKMWREALAVLDQMREEGFNESLEAHNSAISALQKVGEWPMALVALENMKSCDLVPSVVTHTAIIGTMCNRLDVDKAAEWLHVMRADEVEPNHKTYAKVINRMVTVGQFESAIDVWDELRSSGITPTQDTCESAARACSQLERWEQLLEVVRLMELHELQQTPLTKRSAATAKELLGLVTVESC